MIFWDSSALVPIILDEPATNAVRRLLEADHSMIVWWATPVECLSAIARRERDCTLTTAQADAARHNLGQLMPSWNEVLASARVREHAGRLLLRHPLRSADALQLAAALTWARDRPREHAVCTLDARLARAAKREGFRLALE